MEGHGVVEVDIPDIEPVPGSRYVYDPACVLFHYSVNQWMEYKQLFSG